MACGYTTTPTTPVQANSIAELLRRIDQIQKEAILSNIADRCETCMIGARYNTKPIAIYNQCGRVEVASSYNDVTPVNLFRVEEVRGTETVLLRLLEVDSAGNITCSNQTVVYRIGCICAVQCFEPINCDPCNRTLAN